MAGHAAIAAKLSLLFHLPRGYAVGSRGKWSRVHETLDEPALIRLLDAGTPVALALRSPSGGDLYSDSHYWATFDVDSDGGKPSAPVADRISDELRSAGFKPLVTVSGQKGNHVFVFFDTPHDANTLRDWQDGVMKACGFGKTSQQKYKAVGAIVETLLSTGPGDGKVVKIPFSPHPRRAAVEMPVRSAVAASESPPSPEDGEAVLLDAEFSRPIVAVVRSPPAGPGRVTVGSARARPRPKPQEWSVPPAGNHSVQKTIANRIETTPCLKAAMDRATSEKGVFWERVVIATTLASAGVPAEETAVFIRDNINDAEDNSDPKKLHYYVDYCYQNRGWSTCRIFQNPDGHAPVCPGPCGRSAPFLNGQTAPVVRPAESQEWRKCSCGGRMFKTVGKERVGLLPVSFACQSCGSSETAVVDSTKRAAYARFRPAFAASPRTTFCRRLLDEYVNTHTRQAPRPPWMLVQSLKCNRCEAWDGESAKCSTGDEVFPTRLYTDREIKSWLHRRVRRKAVV